MRPAAGNQCAGVAAASLGRIRWPNGRERKENSTLQKKKNNYTNKCRVDAIRNATLFNPSLRSPHLFIHNSAVCPPVFTADWGTKEERTATWRGAGRRLRLQVRHSFRNRLKNLRLNLFPASPIAAPGFADAHAQQFTRLTSTPSGGINGSVRQRRLQRAVQGEAVSSSKAESWERGDAGGAGSLSFLESTIASRPLAFQACQT